MGLSTPRQTSRHCLKKTWQSCANTAKRSHSWDCLGCMAHLPKETKREGIDHSASSARTNPAFATRGPKAIHQGCPRPKAQAKSMPAEEKHATVSPCSCEGTLEPALRPHSSACALTLQAARALQRVGSLPHAAPEEAGVPKAELEHQDAQGPPVDATILGVVAASLPCTARSRTWCETPKATITRPHPYPGSPSCLAQVRELAPAAMHHQVVGSR